MKSYSTLKISTLLSFCFLMIIAGTFTAYSQAPTMNIEGTANSVVSKLNKSLTLTEVQKPKLLTAVTNFLRQKVNIETLKTSNEKAYTTKLNSMQNGLLSKLKTLLSSEQMTTYLSLKPKTYDETDVLSHLFY